MALQRHIQWRGRSGGARLCDSRRCCHRLQNPHAPSHAQTDDGK